MRGLFMLLLACAQWHAVSGSAVLSGQTPAPGPTPGTAGPPCICTPAAIRDGQVVCFAVTDSTKSDGTTAKIANPQCTVSTANYNCSGAIYGLGPGTQVSAYPNQNITGMGIFCRVVSFTYTGPLPAPPAPAASPNAPACITVPAGDYGPTGVIAYTNGPNNAPSPDCTVSSGTVCSINISYGSGTAKICASEAAERVLPG